MELAKDLRLKPVYLLGHLHALWHAALEQQEDGDLSSWSDELIAEMSGFDGDAPQFVSLLQTHGWLDGKVLHDWLDYAGKYLTAKYRTANPRKLRQILFKHKSSNSRTKVRPKSVQDAIGLSHHKVLKSSEGDARGGNGALPDWIPSESWDGFCEHRRRLHKPLGERAKMLTLNNLERLKEQGNDPAAVLDQSVANGWTGIFPIKSDAGERQKEGELSELTKRRLRRGL